MDHSSSKTGSQLLEPWPDPTNPVTVTKTGYELLRDPLLNKGIGFTAEERSRFALEGLLPAAEASLETQARWEYEALAAKDSPTARLLHLTALMNDNEHLFYRVLRDHLTALMPVVYTPTVAWATRNFSFSTSYRTRQGVWLTPGHRGRMAEVLERAVGERAIKLVVATDNESILGIGDQGGGGIAIAIGKLALYTAGAGIPPSATLPVSLDIGTDNAALLEDEHYAGWRAPRLRGHAYDAFIDEFVAALRQACPGAVVQWEDFRKDSAERILERHRTSLPSFNDDIQGTGAVALAGVLGASRISGVALAEQRIAIFGAGAAGLGIVRQLRNAMRLAGVGEEELAARVAVLDSRGLLVEDRAVNEAYKRELQWPAGVAASYGLEDPAQRDLETVVRRFRPSVLIGTSGQPDSFTEPMIREMASHCARPVIMPFSNPTDHAEATPERLMRWSDGRALIAAGSPFPPIDHAGTRTVIGQGNNVFVFPGIGLGALLAGVEEITDTQVSCAAMALAEQVSEQERSQGQLFPSVERLRAISKEVAVAVCACALEERAAEGERSQIDREVIARHVERLMWEPVYRRYRRG